MIYAALRTSADTISSIVNWVCPDCGGRMGGRTREFKCQGDCQRDWRGVWLSSLLVKPTRLNVVTLRSRVLSIDRVRSG
jgi:hypothetical protein